MPDKSKTPTLYEVWQLYQLEMETIYTEKVASAQILCAQTALIRYTLPGWGYPAPAGKRMTAAEIEQGLENMREIDLRQLSTARQAQAEVFEEVVVTKASERTYRYSLNHLMEWYESQPWSIKSAESKKQKKPKQAKSDYRSVNSRPRNEKGELIQEYEYGLGIVEGDEISFQLAEDLENYKKYRLGLHELSQGKAVRLVTVEQDLKRIRLMLGWQYRHCGIPSHELTLAGLLSDKKSSSNLEILTGTNEVKYELGSLPNYLSWLIKGQEKDGEPGRGIKSTHTVIGIVQTLKNVAKYLDREKTKKLLEKNDQNNRIIRILEKIKIAQQEKLEKLFEKQDQENNISWYEYLELTEKLREECVVSSQFEEDNLKDYSLEEIAQKHQRFILSALFAYVFPNTSTFYRTLHVGRISENYTMGYIHRKEGNWFIVLLDIAFGQSNNFPINKEVKQIEIPNIKYPDNRCFYDYLEEWLIQYHYSKSNIEKNAPEGLRRVFKPEHNFLFSKRNGQHYKHQTEFNRILQNRTVKLTKKRVNFSLLRSASYEFTANEMKRLKVYITYPDTYKKDKIYFATYMNILHINVAKRFIDNYRSSLYITSLVLSLLSKKKLYLIVIIFLQNYPKISLTIEDFQSVVQQVNLFYETDEFSLKIIE